MALPDNLNIADLKLVGEGNQGIVYLIDQTRCLKVYKRSKFFARELSVLQKTKGEPRFPALYSWGDKYMIREYIPGIDLETYLKKNTLTEAISRQLLEIIETLKRLRFKRLDTRLAHIIITPNKELRIIDPTNAMNKSRSHPERLLAGLENLGFKEIFLEHAQKINPALAEKWGGGGDKRKSVKEDHHRHEKHKLSLENLVYNLFE
jgi:predicted Ser/Thr protein kinase